MLFGRNGLSRRRGKRGHRAFHGVCVRRRCEWDERGRRRWKGVYQDDPLVVDGVGGEEVVHGKDDLRRAEADVLVEGELDQVAHPQAASASQTRPVSARTHCALRIAHCASQRQDRTSHIAHRTCTSHIAHRPDKAGQKSSLSDLEYRPWTDSNRFKSLNSPIEKSEDRDACMPSFPMIPTPTSAERIIGTSFPPSPIASEILFNRFITSVTTSAFCTGAHRAQTTTWHTPSRQPLQADYQDNVSLPRQCLVMSELYILSVSAVAIAGVG
eukprot:3428271-Rhodomonas_salina.1